MEEAFLEGLSKGLTVNDLLNSESPNYIATKDVLLKYSRTLREQSLEISEGLEIDNPNLERKFKTIDEYENNKINE